MTLIAAINYNGSIVIIGDLLLSSKNTNFTVDRIIIPSGFVNILEVTTDGWSPAGWMQKIVLIHDKLVLMWSGSTQNIHEIIVRFRARLRQRGMSLKNVTIF